MCVYMYLFVSRDPLREVGINDRNKYAQYIINIIQLFFLKVFPIVVRYADKLTEKLGQSNSDEPVDVKQYVVDLLYGSISSQCLKNKWT